MKKKILALVMAAAMTLGLTACGGGDSSSAGSAASTGSQSAGSASNVSASDFKVGAIYINKKSDTAGYTYAHHTGITKAMEELGLDPDSQLVIVDEVNDNAYDGIASAVDTLVDILGACWALDQLGVERVTACALPWFGGSITCAHGEIPLPAPATANLMRGLPVYPTEAKTELVPPTGAALARVLVDEFVEGPEGRLLAMGTGYGARPAPTGLRAWLVEAREPRQADHGQGGEEDVMQLECHLDHLTGEELDACFTLDYYMKNVDYIYRRAGIKEDSEEER